MDKYFLAGLGLGWAQYFSFSILLPIICAVHAYFIASSFISIENRPWYSRWYGLIGIPALLFVAIFIMKAFLLEPFRIPASSMAPSINKGAHVIVSKVGFYHIGSFGIDIYKSAPTVQIERGSVIVFEYPKNPEINYLKRVIGLPGDSIEYGDKTIFINGEKTPKKYLYENEEGIVYEEKIGDIVYTINNDQGRRARDFSATVPADAYFVLGDNRDHSNDSRFWGSVPDKSIVGKVIYTFQ